MQATHCFGASIWSSSVANDNESDLIWPFSPWASKSELDDDVEGILLISFAIFDMFVFVGVSGIIFDPLDTGIFGMVPDLFDPLLGIVSDVFDAVLVSDVFAIAVLRVVFDLAL